MKNWRRFFSVLFFVFFSAQIFSQTDDVKTSDQEELEIILEKCAEYCERVKSIAMFYVCQEEIKDKTNFYRTTDTLRTTPYGITEIVPGKSLKLKRTRKSSYLYNYQLINKEEELQEQRTLLKKNNRKKNIKNAELEIRFNAKYLVYGPVGFLSQYWQNFFSYKIIGQESLGEIQATIIRATPKPNNKDNWNFAKIWINERDRSILQIEWGSGSIDDFGGKNIASMSGDFRTDTIVRATYLIEKNGVRFPSRQLIQEFLVSESGKRYLRHEMTTIFNDYKFFIVETEVKYQSREEQ